MSLSPIAAITPQSPVQTAPLRRAAEELEVAFLTEMLKSAGLGQTAGAFGGGAGEEQFASFLREEHARQMVDAGGIGLAERIFESMTQRAAAT